MIKGVIQLQMSVSKVSVTQQIDDLILQTEKFEKMVWFRFLDWTWKLDDLEGDLIDETATQNNLEKEDLADMNLSFGKFLKLKLQESSDALFGRIKSAARQVKGCGYAGIFQK